MQNMKKPSKTYLMGRADDLCRNLAYAIGKCEAAGEDRVPCAGRLEWAHCRSRDIKGLRYDRRNYFCLCSSHHWFYHSNPPAFSRFIRKAKGEEVHDWLMGYKIQSGLSTVEWYQEKIADLTTESSFDTAS